MIRFRTNRVLDFRLPNEMYSLLETPKFLGQHEDNLYSLKTWVSNQQIVY